jgi:cation transport ATPase
VVVALLVSMVRDLLAGRLGVDAVAFVSMSAALILGEGLAGAVVAVMYAGGNVLEDFAVARAERDLRSLVDRAPRAAHRLTEGAIEDIPIEEVAVGDAILVRGGEVVPVDGVVSSANAMIDESALTGEPIPVNRRAGEPARSGTLSAGEAFEIRATATAGESTYAGIVRMVTAAQTAKAPFIRLADRYALLLLPIALVVAGAARCEGSRRGVRNCARQGLSGRRYLQAAKERGCDLDAEQCQGTHARGFLGGSYSRGAPNCPRRLT